MGVYIFLGLILAVAVFIAWKISTQKNQDISSHIRLSVSEGINNLKDELNRNNIVQAVEIGDIKKSINDELHRFKQDITRLGDEQIKESKESLRDNFLRLQEQVEKRLEDINAKVENRLSKGFEETNKTFINIIERLTKIDEA